MVVLAGPLPKPHRIFDKARLEENHAGLHIADNLQTAISLAGRLMQTGTSATVVARPPATA